MTTDTSLYRSQQKIGDLVESNDYQKLIYDEDGSEAFTTGSCHRCNSESVPLLVVTDHPDDGDVFTRHVCIQCGHLIS